MYITKTAATASDQVRPKARQSTTAAAARTMKSRRFLLRAVLSSAWNYIANIGMPQTSSAHRHADSTGMNTDPDIQDASTPEGFMCT